MAEEQTDRKAITEGRFSESIGAVIVILIASWVSLVVGASLLAGARRLSIIFAICSMGAFVIAYCNKDK